VKLGIGILLLVIGVGLLIISIPYAILNIIGSINQLTQSNVSGGIPTYLGIIGVIVGLVMTGIGAVRVFKR